MFSKGDRYQRLCEAAAACRLCPEVFHPLTYLNEKNGNIESPVMFIGEAPGFVKDPKERGMAFHGNQSGANFEYLLSTIGLKREDVFVTNALLHTPTIPAGRITPDYGPIQIRPPRPAEIVNCGRFLRDQIRLVDPKVVVTIGAAAVRACRTNFPDFPEFHIREGVGSPFEWDRRFVMPLYHTSPNVTASIRSLQQMEGDFKKLGGLLQFLNIL